MLKGYRRSLHQVASPEASEVEQVVDSLAIRCVVRPFFEDQVTNP
jgi:hypothetical protein